MSIDESGGVKYCGKRISIEIQVHSLVSYTDISVSRLVFEYQAVCCGIIEYAHLHRAFESVHAFVRERNQRPVPTAFHVGCFPDGKVIRFRAVRP